MRVIIEEQAVLAPDMEPMHRFDLIELFKDRSISCLTERRVVAIVDNGIEVINVRNGKKEKIEVNKIVVALGVRPVDSLIASLTNTVPEVFSVGDCNEPRGFMEAVYESSLVGRQI